MISVETGFECANGKNITRLAEDRFRVEVDGDKLTGYAAYFCFDVVNEGPARDVTVELWYDSALNNPEAFMSCFPTTVWLRPEGFHRARPLHERPVETLADHVVIPVPMGADQRVRVSLTYTAAYSEVTSILRRLADERPDRLQLFSVGASVQGREILGVQAGTQGKPKVMCIAGQHPHEHPGVWGMLGIADFISSGIPEAARLRGELDVEIIPCVNPDGNVLGRNAFNAEGLDMYLAFGDNPDAPEPEAHESGLLWRRIVEQPPALWMNLHCYTGWRLNSEYPYDGWYEVEDRSLFAAPARRELYDALCDMMRLQTDAPSTHERASIHPETSLCCQMARRWGIPHVFYEINNATAGAHGGSRRGLNVFTHAVDTLLAYQDTSG